MKTYTVTFDAVYTASIEVRAENENEAEEIAEAKVDKGYPLDFQYSKGSIEVGHVG